MTAINKSKFKTFIIDVDGVFTDGKFHYSKDGKVMKVFGPDDHDGLLLLKPFMNVVTVSGDKRGFPITKKRIADDMKLPLFMVSTLDRVAWIEKNFNTKETIYMGDSLVDAMIFDKVGYAIAPANSYPEIKKYADYVTKAKGGEGAVAEASMHLLKKFFKKPNLLNLQVTGGIWGKRK